MARASEIGTILFDSTKQCINLSAGYFGQKALRKEFCILFYGSAFIFKPFGVRRGLSFTDKSFNIRAFAVIPIEKDILIKGETVKNTCGFFFFHI